MADSLRQLFDQSRVLLERMGVSAADFEEHSLDAEPVKKRSERNLARVVDPETSTTVSSGPTTGTL